MRPIHTNMRIASAKEYWTYYLNNNVFCVKKRKASLGEDFIDVIYKNGILFMRERNDEIAANILINRCFDRMKELYDKEAMIQRELEQLNMIQRGEIVFQDRNKDK